MRLQLKTASTGTSTRRTTTQASRDGASRRGTVIGNGPASLAPNLCRTAIVYTVYTTIDRQKVGGDGRPPLSEASASVRSTNPCVRSADQSVRTMGGTAEEASVPIGWRLCRTREKTDADRARQPRPNPQPRAGGRHAHARRRRPAARAALRVPARIGRGRGPVWALLDRRRTRADAGGARRIRDPDVARRRR